MNRFLKHIRGEVIHSTSAQQFRQIVSDGAIRRGLNDSPVGFCQHKDGLAKHLGPCLSLSDLSLSTDNQLSEPFVNWDQQLIQPWFAYQKTWAQYSVPAMASVTIVLDRTTLDASKYFTWKRVQSDIPTAVTEHGLPTAGKFIHESEVCYAADIPTASFKRVLAICDRKPHKHLVLEWDPDRSEELLSRILDFETQMQKEYPPSIKSGPIPPEYLKEIG